MRVFRLAGEGVVWDTRRVGNGRGGRWQPAQGGLNGNDGGCVPISNPLSHTQLADVVEQTPNMIFINHRGRIIFANNRCEELMGYTCEEFYADDFDFMQLIAKKDRSRIQANFTRHMMGQEVGPIEYTVMTKSGHRLDAVIATKLVQYKEGQAILGIVTDVTELKRAQRALSEQAKALEIKNVALKEILAQIESEKLQIRREVRKRLEKRILPIVARLRRTSSSLDKRHVDLLESNLRDLTGEFGNEVAQGMMVLTPTEVQVSNLIRSGMTSKEMSEFLHISLRTVETHRTRIRKKLGIGGKDINLATYLQTL